MTDHPIIFSDTMVLALLAGRKSQTRRLAWGKSDYDGGRLGWPKSRWQRVQPGDRLWVREACRAEELSRRRSKGAQLSESAGCWNGRMSPSTMAWTALTAFDISPMAPG